MPLKWDDSGGVIPVVPARICIYCDEEYTEEGTAAHLLAVAK